MKKLMILLGFLGAVACSEDKTEDSAAVTKSPLEVTLNAASFCRGETMTATIRIADTEEGAALQESDFQLYFETLENGAHSDLFAEFPSEVTFPAGSDQITVDFPIKESGFTGEHTVTLWVSAVGRAIEGAAQTVTIGDYHYVTLSVKGATSYDVIEGQTFVLQASILEPAASDLVITLTPEEQTALADFEDFPATLTIEAGKTVGEAPATTVAWDEGETQEDHSWNFTGTTVNDKYAVKPFALTRIDNDLAKGDRLLDERWVYDYPDRAFYSTSTEKNYLNCPSYKENDVLMTASTEYGKGSKHPNRSLADTWTLLNASEFHALNGTTRSAKNTDGVCPPVGWAAQATVAIEKTCHINTNKYTDVTDGGYLRMWAANDAGNTQTGGGEERAFGSGALYANKNKSSGNVFKPQNTMIRVGTRVEVRARVCGAVQGFNFAIWLQGNSNIDGTGTAWPQCGEIDIMENPVMTSNVAGTVNTVHQTLHYGTPVENAHANPTVNKQIVPTDWNIYWVEIVDEHTINFGINGVTTATFTDQNPQFPGFKWPFNNTDNVNGYHILLTTGLAAEWACGPLTTEEVNAGGWAASEFLKLSYEQTKTDANTPRMEVDWVRYWINENYTDEGAAKVFTNAQMF